MKARATAASATALILLLAGCSQDGTLSTSGLNTSSIDQQNATKQASKSQDAVCLTLTSQIEALNTEGIPDKVAKAAAKKYKLKPTDITKADELNKANTEFQTKCSSYPPRPTVAAVTTEPAPTATSTAAPKVAKAKPPVPAPKPVAAAMAPQASTSATQVSSPATTPVADGSSMPAP
jgi:hypothetical protein